MKSNPIFYTYSHCRADTGVVFYIGKGSAKRAWSNKCRNRHWHNVVKKHGYQVTIEAAGLDSEKAFELEQLLIALHGRVDKGTGLLVNRTDGGEGGWPPLVYTKELREKRRVQLAGNKYTFGSKLTTEHKDKIAKGLVGNTNTLGTTASPETKTKMSLAHAGERHHYYGKEREAEVRTKISKALTGTISPLRGTRLSPEARFKISQTLLSKPKIVCPHCGVVGSASTQHRYHFDKCKLNPTP